VKNTYLKHYSLHFFRGNTVQELFPTACQNLEKYRELELNHLSNGFLLESVMFTSDENGAFQLPAYLYSILKARHFLARADYGIAAIHARRAIRANPALAISWCYLAEILAKQDKCKIYEFLIIKV
jgi:hypothetical protein